MPDALRGARARTRQPLTEPQRMLVEAHLPLAIAIARRATKRWPRLRDDFEGDAYLGLCEAAESWVPGGRTKFTTWAYQRILGAICDRMRQQLPNGLRHSRGRRPVPTVAQLDEAAARQSAWAEDGERARLDGDDLAFQVISLLPPQHAAVMRAIVLKGHSRSETARLMGRSERSIAIMYKEARDYLSVMTSPEELDRCS